MYLYLRPLKTILLLSILIFTLFTGTKAQENTLPDFSWGNAHYFNLEIGESIFFDTTEIKLLEVKNHYNRLKIKNDTAWIKVSRRTLPQSLNGLRIFVADNKNVKSLTSDSLVHGLLTKDVLVCLSDYDKPILEQNKYIFPINFNDGFQWNAEIDGYVFSYLGEDKNSGENYYRSHEGIDFDLSDARGLERHWLVAIENSEVMWVETQDLGQAKTATVLLQSKSQPWIFYIYDHLYAKNLEVKSGQQLVQGELIGTAWGDKSYGFLQFAVIKSDTVPDYKNRYNNVVNFFPQIYQMYYKQLFGFTKNFAKGRINFGTLGNTQGNRSNVHAFEDYIGKGWMLGNWNTTDKVDCICAGEQNNVRLQKVLFANSPAECVNPNNYFEYEINVPNGVYRIRAKVGDLLKPSWQKVEFEGVEASVFSLDAGNYKWTNERAVKVNDRRLTVRIYIDSQTNMIAGLSEIVFQQAY